MLSRFGKSPVRSEEFRPRIMSLQNLSDTPAQNSANQYIRVQHQHSLSNLSTAAVTRLLEVVYQFLFGHATRDEKRIKLGGRFP